MRSILVLLLTGCSQYPVAAPHGPVLHPFAAIPEDTARVCVIRPSRFAFATNSPAWDGATHIGTTKAQSYFCYEAEPGHHVLAVQSNGEKTTFEYEAEAGQSAYFVVKLPFAANAPDVTEVTTEEARRLVADLDQVGLTSSATKAAADSRETSAPPSEAKSP